MSKSMHDAQIVRLNHRVVSTVKSVGQRMEYVEFAEPGFPNTIDIETLKELHNQIIYKVYAPELTADAKLRWVFAFDVENRLLRRGFECQVYAGGPEFVMVCITATNKLKGLV